MNREIPLENWRAFEGDKLVVDTETNMGYLVHDNGVYTSFRVATGQRRVVRYIGRTYNATTPPRQWEMTSKETKGDRITFGSRGTFLRLSYDGERTPYGVHSHAQAEAMIEDDERYRSMGCILVTDDMLDLIEETFHANGETLSVTTVYGFDGDIDGETLLAAAE